MSFSFVAVGATFSERAAIEPLPTPVATASSFKGVSTPRWSRGGKTPFGLLFHHQSATIGSLDSVPSLRRADANLSVVSTDITGHCYRCNDQRELVYCKHLVDKAVNMLAQW